MVEAIVVATLRLSGIPMQQIRPAVSTIQHKLGIPHPLAHDSFKADGVEIFMRARNRGRAMCSELTLLKPRLKEHFQTI